ncbi:hypothetical protein GGS20DRAFT_580476 [Poronia punctata]|nr:hypothetical protein GGS20DRAFT_580476 [Poronia punctata]
MGNSKRKLPSTEEYKNEHHESEPETKKPKKSKKTEGEKRLRRFRPKAPSSFEVIYERATSQKFYVLSRTQSGPPTCPEETFEIAGSTGNIYNVHIAEQPVCSCPHAIKGNQCKHIIYVLSRVLRTRYELVYQLALLPSELVEIFQNAHEHDQEGNGKEKDKNRKEIEGDCPICFSPFEETEKVVYCRATCGQNMHKGCFEMWAATKRKSAGDAVTCPMCRSPWQGDEDMVRKIIKNTGVVGPDGYVNVADQLGISGVRDHSTYHRWSGYRGGGYGGPGYYFRL